MEKFSSNLKLLLRNYEGYFSFGSLRGFVIDDKITFLTVFLISKKMNLFLIRPQNMVILKS